ncbi:MAG: hypothetical protein EA411_11790 [Saprospirales bacterium]|nr:MAG: hypothetical protein EA411_11790 [Saprospirales bacterium]
MSNGYRFIVAGIFLLFCSGHFSPLWGKNATPASLNPITCQFLGPDTIYVDSNCVAPLFWDETNNPECENSSAGGVIISRTLTNISGGYEIGDLVPGGTEVEITYRVTDNQGNTLFFTFSIFFVDTIAPVFDPATLPTDTTIHGQPDLPTADIFAYDNCDTTGQNTTISFEDSPLPDLCEGGDWTRTYTATDQFGNQISYVQTITQLPDTSAPVFLTDPVDTLVNCEDLPEAYSQWLENQYRLIEIENPDGSPIELADNGPLPGEIIDLCGPLEIEFTAIDSCGNFSTTTAIFEILDTIAPNITSPPIPLVIDCSTVDGDSVLQNWIDNHGFALVSNNCSAVEWHVEPMPGDSDFFCNDTATVTWYAQDACGNTTTAETYIYIQDTLSLEFDVAPVDELVACDAENLDSTLHSWLQNFGGAEVSSACWSAERVEMNFLLNGVEADSSQIMMALQNSLEAECRAVELSTGDSIHKALGVVEIGFLATDFCGNQAVSHAKFVVIDTIGPEITQQPRDTIIQCEGAAEIEAALQEWYLSGGGMEAEDNCSDWSANADIEFTELLDLFWASSDTSCGLTGRVEVLFFAGDKCGNLNPATESVSFQVIDTLSPVLIDTPQVATFHCNQEIDVEIQDWIVQLGMADISDPCSPIVPGNFSWTTSDGRNGSGSISDGPYPEVKSELCELELTVEFEVEDGCGNILTFQGMAVVIDETAPSFFGTPDTAWYNCDEPIDSLQVVVSDPCSDFTISFKDSLLADSWSGCGNFEQLGQRTITAEDVCGNTAIFTQTLIVSDFKPPIFTVPQDVTVDCRFVQDTVITGSPTNISDNCFELPEITIQFEDEISPDDCEPTILRIWSATDGCENTAVDTQFIFTVDTLPPGINEPSEELILQCGQPDNTELFANWLESAGFAEIDSPCGEWSFFAAISGSYDSDDESTFPGTMPEMPQLLSCDSLPGPIHYSEEVDFIFIDGCGNTSISTALLELRDDDPPVFSHCPDDVVVSTSGDTCTGIFTTPGFSVYDLCGMTIEQGIVSDTASLVASIPGNANSVVEDVIFVFSDLYDPLKPFLSMELEIELVGVDAEQPTEYFLIYDQDGELLGTTENSPEQCGNSTATISIQDEQRINRWIANDSLAFHLQPYYNDSLSGSFFINDICQPGIVMANIVFSRATSSELNIKIYPGYFPPVALTEFPVDGFEFSVGNHPVLIKAEDCSGNTSICNFDLIVEHKAEADVTCPENAQLYAPDTVCYAQFELPQVNYQAECDNFGTNIYSHPPNEFGFIYFFEHPDLGDLNATEKTLHFGPFTGGHFTDAGLYIQYLVNIDSQYAFFEVMTGGGYPLGTIGGPEDTNTLEHGNCQNAGLAYFTIPDSIFNEEAEGGFIEIVLSPNENLPPFPDGIGTGINPCDSLFDMVGQTDSISFVRGFISYHPVQINIAISGSTQTSEGPLYSGENLPVVELNTGENLIEYMLMDPSGNQSGCYFSVEVIDTVPPNAICKNARIEVLPSALDTFVLGPNLVDGGSWDNCELTQMVVEPNKFTCNETEEEIQVTLTVEDESGNISSCQSTVRIDSYRLEPDFSIDLCEPDTLNLFSNAPGDPTQYSYEWSGPQGFSSNSPNPVISGTGPQNSGNYSVTLTGFGGCTASGSVDVNISTIATPEINASSNVVCEGGPIELTSSVYTGNITYRWYSGTPPSGVLLGTTSQPSFSIDLPLGTHRFYVQVENPDCSSNPSATQTVEVVEDPVAVIDPAFVRVCQGDQLSLSSPLGPAFEYNWSGPAGFVSDMQSPIVTPNAGPENEGIYNLVVTLGTCTSNAVQAEVLVDASPPKPIVQGNNLLCIGDTLQLRVSNIPLATRYTWTLPDGSEQITSTNQLIIENVGTDLSGDWLVKADFGQCPSVASDPFTLVVEENPIINAQSNSPVCEGDTAVMIADPIPDAVYEWSGPGGFSAIGDTIRGLFNPGEYEVFVVTQSGCTASAMTDLQVKTTPEIDAIVNQGQTCVDGTSDLCFQPFLTPADNGNDYTYHWTGPNNFSSDLQSPCLNNVTEFNNGTYYLEVELDGCRSRIDSTVVMVNNIGRQPIIFSDQTNYCEGDSIQLHTDYSPNEGVRFHWVGPTGISITSDSLFSIPDGQTGDGGQYSIFITVDQCTTSVSEEIEIEVNPLPDRPTLTGGGQYCKGDSIVLQTDVNPDVNYIWTGPIPLDQGVDFHVLWPAEIGQSGAYRVIARQNGCNSEPSQPETVVVNPTPPTPSLSLSDDAICLDDTDHYLELCIAADSLPGGATYRFFLNDELGTNVLTTHSICTELFSSQLDKAGSNTIQVRTEINGCLSGFSSPLQFKADTIPDEASFAGEDFNSCGRNGVVLMADFPSVASGAWSSPDPTLSFENVNLPVSEVDGLRPGDNLLVWTLSNGSCKNFSSDTVTVEYFEPPTARDVTEQVLPGDMVTSEVLLNDDLPGEVNLEIISGEGQGAWSLAQGGEAISFQSSERWAGTVRITYEICLVNCPDKCDRAVLYIVAGDDEDCKIPNIFTPNGDGINDAFIISCLASDRFSDSELRIYDRWGSELFRAAPYENDWEGTYNGRPLPEGTYFYVIDFGDGRSPANGFVVIKR